MDDITLKIILVFFCFYIEKKIDSMMPWVCTVLCLRGCSLCSYHILMSFVIYYKTDAWHYGISLISRYVFQSQDKSNFKPPSFLFTSRKNNIHHLQVYSYILSKPPLSFLQGFIVDFLMKLL